MRLGDEQLRLPWAEGTRLPSSPLKPGSGAALRLIGRLYDAVHDPHRWQAFTAGLGEDALTSLAPHYQRARLLHDRLMALSRRETASSEALNVAASAAVLVDEHGAVVRVNERAREILARRDGLTLSRGKLRAASKPETVELRALLMGASGIVTGSGTYRTMVVSRPSGRRSLQLGVTAASLSMSLDLAGVGRAAVLFINDPETPARIGSTSPVLLHALTCAEAAVAAGVANGWSIQKIAASRRVAIGTVRWQIKCVLAKTGTRSKVELVRLLLGSGLRPFAEGDLNDD